MALARGDFRPDDTADAEGALALAWLEEGNLLEAQQAIARADQRLQTTKAPTNLLQRDSASRR